MILFLIGQVLPYITAVVFVIGLGYRIALWASAPSPLKIPLTPAPKTSSGVIGRLATEIITFRSLFYSDKSLWLGGWLTHAALLSIILGHIVGLPTAGREFTLLGLPAKQSEHISALSGTILGLVIVLPLLYLLLRRAANERVRYASAFSDYLAVGLILVIVLAGDYMRLFAPVNGQLVKTYVLDLVNLHPSPLPANGALVVHFAAVNLLLLYLPFSKLVHGVGMLFSPTLNQSNDIREKRHINPWNTEVN